MTLTKLMELFVSPDAILNLSGADKFTASIITTVLGMGITISALVILLFVITWMHKLLSPSAKEAKQTSAQITGKAAEEEENMDEIVAAITAAINLSGRPGNDIVIRNIRRVQDFQPQWSRAGIHDQLSSRI